MKIKQSDRYGCNGAWGWQFPLAALPGDTVLWRSALGLFAAAAALYWLIMHLRRTASLYRAEQERSRLEQRLKTILQHSREALFGFDLQERRFDYLSPAAFSLFGFSTTELEEIIRNDPVQGVHPDDREHIIQLIGQLCRPAAHAQEWLGTVEYRFKHSAGEYRDISAYLCVRYNEQGHPAYVSGCVHDVSTNKRLEDNLQALEKRFQEATKMAGLGLLASGVAHDFNNLMTVVLGNTELALMEQNGADKRALEEIRRTALRAADLATQILVYSGKTPLTLVSINLSAVVKEMGALLDVSISKKVRIEYCLTEDLRPIRGDISQIRQVAMNLITNASEAIGDRPGVIAISIHETDMETGALEKAFPPAAIPPGRYVQMEVSDTGCGMDEATMRKIFEPLFTTKISGRGLGLASVFNVVQRHNGAITVESRVGEGTVFRVYFPAEERDGGAETENASRSNGAWRGFGTALVADDEEAIRSITTALLERAGFKVVTAADGRETLEIFTKYEQAITLLLIDLNMPHMDGYEAIRRIRHINPSVPALLMSGYSREQVMKKIENQTRMDFIKKPFQAAELIEQVRGVMEKRESE